MKLAGYEILKEIVKRREVSFADAFAMIEKKYNDRRDYYALASLCTSDFVNMSIKFEGRIDLNSRKNIDVASDLYNLSQGKKVSIITGNPESDKDVEYLQNYKFFCTAKADLYFHELRHKRLYLVGTLCVSILVGIVSAFFGAYFTALFVSSADFDKFLMDSRPCQYSPAESRPSPLCGRPCQ